MCTLSAVQGAKVPAPGNKSQFIRQLPQTVSLKPQEYGRIPTRSASGVIISMPMLPLWLPARVFVLLLAAAICGIYQKITTLNILVLINPNG
jgi:hypothetical protein